MFIRSLSWMLLIASIVSRFDLPTSRGDEAPAMRIQLLGTTLPAAAEMRDRIYRAMQRQLRPLLATVKPWSEVPSLLLITESKSGEHHIRPNTSMIEGMAFLYRFGPYDEKITGISRADLLKKVLLPMMRYCLITHKTGDRVTSDGRAWGDAWQSAHWAQMLGSAAWWIWDDLPEDMQAQVRQLVAHEADRFVDADPPHNLRNDTKAEENAWNSQIMAVATVLMPDDPRRPAWDKGFQRWALSAYLRPADKQSQVLVDGRPVAEQYTGANILDDFTLENHGFVHPDYMTTFATTLGCTLRYRMTGRREPDSLQYNAAGIYENLKWFTLPDGGFVYPNGQDWELFRNPGWIYAHVLMSVFTNDPDAWQLAKNSLVTLEKMQNRNGSGDIQRDDEFEFPSSRVSLFRSLAHTWLALELAQEIDDAPRERIGVLRLDAGKVVLHRTPHAVNSFSWGSKSMAMCVPLRLDRIVSPDQRSGIGRIWIEGSDTPLQVRTIDAQVKSDSQSFSADMVVEHGEKLIRAEIHVASDPPGVFTLRERLVATANVTTQEIATGLVGILNNPHWIYETGQRAILLQGEEIIVPALSGKELQRSAVSTIGVDGVLQITSERPLTVKYQADHQMKRGRATDALYLNYLVGKRSWHKGDVISEYSVRISCNGN
jgi:hypothetical protein